jgi:hypothetical protein
MPTAGQARDIDGLLLVSFRLAGEDRKAIEMANFLGIFSGNGSPEEQAAAIQSISGSGFRFERYVDRLAEMASRRELTPDVRASAAWVLVAASEDLALPALGRRAIDSIGDIDVSSTAYVQARMIYEAVHGSPSLAVELAGRLSDAAQSSPPREAFAYLCSSGGASCRAGDLATACVRYEAAYSLAKEQRIPSRCVMAASLIADIAWESGNDAEARRWYNAATEHIKESNGIDSAIQYHAVGIQLAIDDGLFQRARDILSEAEQTFPRVKHDRLRVDSLAYDIRIALAAGQSPGAHKINELLKAHLAWRHRGLQDLPTDTLLWALQQEGQSEYALALRNEYLTKHRKDRFPIGLRMARLHGDVQPALQ